ncbi:putative gustatory receptor 2a [Dirofilaria immitis]
MKNKEGCQIRKEKDDEKGMILNLHDTVEACQSGSTVSPIGYFHGGLCQRDLFAVSGAFNVPCSKIFEIPCSTIFYLVLLQHSAFHISGYSRFNVFIISQLSVI